MTIIFDTKKDFFFSKSYIKFVIVLFSIINTLWFLSYSSAKAMEDTPSKRHSAPSSHSRLSTRTVFSEDNGSAIQKSEDKQAAHLHKKAISAGNSPQSGRKRPYPYTSSKKEGHAASWCYRKINRTNFFPPLLDVSRRIKKISGDISPKTIYNKLKNSNCCNKKDTSITKILKEKKYLDQFLQKLPFSKKKFMQAIKGRSNTEIINGRTGATIYILKDRTNTFGIAIKRFNVVEKGIEELTASLLALKLNPAPHKIKMAKIYDAFISADNCLNIVMELAHKNTLFYYLSTDLAEPAVQACAEYFAQFHLEHGQKLNNTDIKEKYLSRVEYHLSRTYCSPLKEKIHKEHNLFSLVPENQSQNIKGEGVRAHNIIQLLPEEEQKKFISLVKKRHRLFAQDCWKTYRALQTGDAHLPRIYLPTIVHGDATGHNILFNPSRKLKKDNNDMPLESFLRIIMIDFSTIGIGEQTADLGRIGGSLWEWAAQQTDRIEEAVKEVKTLEKTLLRTYLRIVKRYAQIDPLFTQENWKEFKKTFYEKYEFYKLSFYRIIFNSPQSKKMKINLAKFCLQEQLEKPKPRADCVKNLPEKAKKIIQYCAYLNAGSISKKIFSSYCNPEEQEEALQQLSSLSLVEKKGTKGSFSIHRFVQMMVRNEQESSSLYLQTFRDVVAIFDNFFTNNNSNQNINKIFKNFLHILALTQHSNDLNTDPEKIERLQWCKKLITAYIYQHYADLKTYHCEFPSEKILSPYKEKWLKEIHNDARYHEEERNLPTPSALVVPETVNRILEKSHPPLQYALGLLYYHGWSVKEDYVKSQKWFIKAAHGNTNSDSHEAPVGASYYLGKIYAEGLGGISKSPEQSHKWYKRAAELGHPDAKFIVGQ